MKDLLVVLWVFFPAIAVFLVISALQDPSVKRDWLRIGIMTFVLSCMLMPYAAINLEIRQKIEEYFEPKPEPVAAAPSGLPPALRSQTVPRGAYNQWVGHNPTNIYSSQHR
jgi:hypothetical protein